MRTNLRMKIFIRRIIYHHVQKRSMNLTWTSGIPHSIAIHIFSSTTPLGCTIASTVVINSNRTDPRG